ncbi:MAG TPA: hypothetical protein PKE45_19035, partial [Caldilineaceae bacterium]|nr:hypothetical protein [Caldilineaceae bacterium]
MPGTGVGAHWHVQNPVSFVATDDTFQEIPWVQVEKNGETVTYVASGADPELIANAENEKRTMDCIDCHSRSGHPVNKPADVVDDAMANNRIPADLPYVKAQTMAVLDQRYASREEALTTIETNLRSYYQTEYPDVYASRQADVDRTISETQKIFAQTSFPYMNVYWDTYPNNTGHINSPGCWRCHDGNHLSEQGTAIPPSCNLCHGVPLEASEGEVLPVLSLGDGKMPESHQSSLWISEHRFRFDATCDDCHTVSNPGGTTNTSFCSNSGCHARDWQYLQIDTPAVLALSVPTEQPAERRLPNIPHPLVEEMNCDNCHGLGKPLAYPEDHTEYSQDECTDCHRLAPDVRAELAS